MVLTSSNKVRAAWKIIKGNSGNLQTHNMIIKINYGQALTNTNEIANTFNQYYTKTVTNINTRRSDPHKASLLLGNKKMITLNG